MISGYGLSGRFDGDRSGTIALIAELEMRADDSCEVWSLASPSTIAIMTIVQARHYQTVSVRHRSVCVIHKTPTSARVRMSKSYAATPLQDESADCSCAQRACLYAPTQAAAH